jgi:hypothetical protein
MQMTVWTASSSVFCGVSLYCRARIGGGAGTSEVVLRSDVLVSTQP